MAKCTSPVSVSGYEVRCRKCAGCRQTHVDSWTLSALAEAESSVEAWTITLTYRPGEPGESFLRYSDVQRMFKRLRRAGHVFRYMCAGEYGTRKGRPHWHLMLFFRSDSPSRGVVVGKSDCGTYERRHVDWWPHGHVVIDPSFEARNVRYVCKYIQKSGGAAGKFTASKRPGIGQEYFDDHARRRAFNGSPLSRNEFTIDGWRASLSPNRWLRYRQQTVAALKEVGKAYLADAFSAYENILTPDDRLEFEAAREAGLLADKLAASAQGVQVHYSNPQETLTTYHLGDQAYMRLEIIRREEVPRWLSGIFHGSGGSVSPRAALAATVFGKRRVFDVAISPMQLQTISERKRPLPEPNPNARSDWLTDFAASLRRQLVISSRAALAPVLSSAPRYGPTL